MARTVGTGSFVGTKHRVHLKYCEAVINEILRLSSTQPLLSRATISKQGGGNIDIGGGAYSLPANTPVFVNAYAIHRDSKYWLDSDRFDPSRWLNEKGELASHLNSFIPFGAGPRSCIGDSLSRMILFLVVVNLVQRFEISVPAGQERLGGKVGVMRRAPDYDLDFKVRN